MCCSSFNFAQREPISPCMGHNTCGIQSWFWYLVTSESTLLRTCWERDDCIPCISKYWSTMFSSYSSNLFYFIFCWLLHLFLNAQRNRHIRQQITEADDLEESSQFSKNYKTVQASKNSLLTRSKQRSPTCLRVLDHD